MPVYSSPLLDIALPKPLVVPTFQLSGLYACMLGLDYVLLRHHKQLMMSKKMVRIGITAIHAAVPICIVSPHVPNNVAFAAIPWFLASYSAYLPTEQFTLKQWIQALYDTVVDRTGQTSHAFGLIKMARGLAKLVLLYVGVQPLLPTMPDAMLNYPWFSSESLSYTFLFGVKAYLVLGCADVTAGLAQALTGWRMVDMFDSPILATSPIDFWSRRWNKTVRNLLHVQVFRSQHTSSSKLSRGLLTFVTSGIFHELIVWSISRKITLENFSFFTLHGIACMIQAKYGSKAQPKGWKRFACVLAQLSFMTLTGRLFLAPFLRTRFTQVLTINKHLF